MYPQNISVIQLLSTSVTVMWFPVPIRDQNGIITFYEIEYNQSTFSTIQMHNLSRASSSEQETTLDGLQEFTNYSARIRAYTSRGAGPFSNPIAVETLQDS